MGCVDAQPTAAAVAELAKRCALAIGQDHKLRRGNTVERGYQYDPAGAAKERPGVSPILLPCSMSAGGNRVEVLCGPLAV